MSLKLKVCGLRDETNFSQLAALNIDFLGLIFIPSSSRFIDTDQAIKLSKINRGKALLTGLFQNQDSGFICEMVQAVRLDAIQVYGDRADAKELKSLLPQLKILKATTVQSLPTVSTEGVDYLLVDNEQGGSGVKFDWRGLSQYQGKTPLMIAGGIGPDDVEAVRELSSMHPTIDGVDVSSRFEISVCNKDINKIREFRELLCR